MDSQKALEDGRKVAESLTDLRVMILRVPENNTLDSIVMTYVVDASQVEAFKEHFTTFGTGTWEAYPLHDIRHFNYGT